MRLGLIFRLFQGAAAIQRKRMFLTVMAIAWGTVAIVLLLAVGEGLKRSMTRGTRGLGEGIAVIWPGETSKDYAGFPAGRPVRLRAEDAAFLVESIPEIGFASGEMNRWGTRFSFGGKDLNKKVTGVQPGFGEMRYMIPQEGGRFLDRLDHEQKRRVIFLGDGVKEDFFGDEPAVGKTILVAGVPFKVIGVMVHKQQMSMYGGPDANQGFIPLSTFETMFSQPFLNELVYKPARPGLMEVAERRVAEILGGKYRFDPEDERALPTWNTQRSQAGQAKMNLGIEIFLGMIGGLTLLIGGVGVANIMFATVKQRSREIGIQMAVGARRAWILGPLVLESSALTALGGVVGLGIGMVLVKVLGYFQSRSDSMAFRMMGEPTFSLPLVLVTIAILGVIGFFSGYFPARRATAIQPAAVLRDE